MLAKRKLNIFYNIILAYALTWLSYLTFFKLIKIEVGNNIILMLLSFIVVPIIYLFLLILIEKPFVAEEGNTFSIRKVVRTLLIFLGILFLIQAVFISLFSCGMTTPCKISNYVIDLGVFIVGVGLILIGKKL